ncbi:DUF4174 domain-containing protein [Sediminitomix flava]|uniref:Uncharacterized protein DUF4174 n=1 Tax=Sediminitomix flava TaxID=379075 RepID=A0A315ZAU8_SEDFL|nr:DUF4174 domain-containing protein [Sediminitomix flava]PWJ41948.1 uncharacterized protein DUF4174 [Sediminitomix flava]
MSQSLENHQWKDRLVILCTQDSSNSIFQKQLNLLKKNKEELNDRKIVIYQVFPDQYAQGLEALKWNSETTFSDQFNPDNSDFKFILIGLDGGIKLERATLVTTAELFSLIDQMPMRKAELEKRTRE